MTQVHAVDLMRRAVRRARRDGHRLRWRLLEALALRRTVRARDLSFTLNCDNWITQYRMDTFDTAEPETLDWIDQRMRDGDLLFDVGGNIGVFTIYAALRHPRASVVVFEPEYANLHLLRDNIIANSLSDRVQVYPIALSDRTGLSRLQVQDLTPGAALHTESALRLHKTEAGGRVVASEGAWAMELDRFCVETGLWPSLVKIDVDGGERRVLTGGTETLARPELRSVLVEVNAGNEADVSHLLQEAGLRHLEIDPPSEAGNQIWVRS